MKVLYFAWLRQRIGVAKEEFDLPSDVHTVDGLAFRTERCPVSPGKLDAPLDRRKLQTTGRVGNAPSSLCLARHVYEMRRSQLARVCPTCTIQPRRGKRTR